MRPILPKIEGGRVQGLLQLIEDGIHLVVAALLVLLAGLLTVGVVHDVIRSIQGPYREETVVLSALDNGLVLFIVAELLHTVRLTIRNQTLDAEPFLVVGLIAGIRKVLIVTAEAEKSFRWNVEGIELLVLAGLILVMATAVYVWRRSTRPGDYFPLQEARRSTYAPDLLLPTVWRHGNVPANCPEVVSIAAPATAPPEPGSLKRIVATSLIGTTIEWYDNSSDQSQDLRLCAGAKHTCKRLDTGSPNRSPAMIVVPTVLAIPAAPALPTVSAVPAVLLIAVVPVVPVIGIATMAPAPGTTTAEVGEAKDQHARSHPPHRVEEAEADQSHHEDEKQNEHVGPPGAERSSLPGAGASPNSVAAAQGLRIAPPVDSYCRA
ncbi:phosphate-starvation-inducible PsiE family protein [Streptomyces sp. NBC_00390]